MEIKQHALKKLVNQKNIREIRKHLLINENENTAYQNLWDPAKMVLRHILTDIKADIKKQKRFQIIS